MLTGTPAAAARRTSARRHGAAAGERRAQRRRPLQPGVEQPRKRRRDEADERDLLLAQRLQHALGLKALVHDRGRRVDRRAHEDRQPADMRQRQRAQPALARVEAERDGRAERAPQQVAVRQLDGLGRGAGARRVDHDGRRIEVVSQRRAAFAARAVQRVRAVQRQRLVDHQCRALDDVRALGCRQAQVHGHGDCAEQHARVQRVGEVKTSRQRDRHALTGPTPRAVSLRARPRRRPAARGTCSCPRACPARCPPAASPPRERAMPRRPCATG